jgi:hypothetical protein
MHDEQSSFSTYRKEVNLRICQHIHLSKMVFKKISIVEVLWRSSSPHVLSTSLN